MKKPLTVILTALFLCTLSQGNAFIPQRHQWWDLRVQDLEKEKISFVKDGAVSPAITEIINRELERARETVGIMAAAMGESTSLSQTKKAYTADELKARVRELSEPLYALQCLELLVNESGNKKNTETAHAQAEQKLKDMALSTLTDPADTKEITSELKAIKGDMWKTLGFELYAGALIEMHKKSRPSFQKALGESITEKLKDGSLTVYPADLDRLIIEKTLEQTADLAESLDQYYQTACDASWQWKTIRSRLDNRINSYRLIRQMLPDTEKLSLNQLKVLHDNPAELEKMAFTPFSCKHRQELQNNDSSQSPDTITLAIPREQKSIKTIYSINSLRKKYAAKITGKESARFFLTIEKKFSSIIDRHMAETEVQFIKEEQRLNKIYSNESIKQYSISNEKDFFIAKSNFYDSLNRAQACADISLLYLKWLSYRNEKTGDAIVKLHRYRSDRNNVYLSFMKTLVENCTALAPIRHKTIHSRFRTCMYRVPDITRYLASLTGQLYNDPSVLTPENIKELRRIHTDYGLIVSKGCHEINIHAQAYARKKAAMVKQKNIRNLELLKNIAQHDIDAVMATAKEYADLYGSLNYNAKAFSLYKSTFDRLNREARSGVISDELNLVFDSGSLLPVIGTFDAQRIQSERTARAFAKKSCETALARVIALLNFYKRNSIAITLPPETVELTQLKKAVSHRHSIQVSSWKIYDDNYAAIDAKLTAELKRTVHMTAVYKNKGLGTSQGPNKKVSLSGKELSFYLPAGWTEDTPGQMDRFKGTEYTFSNETLKSSISLVRVPLDNRSIKEISNEWINKEGKNILRGRWDTHNALRCYRGIGSDKKKQILETFAIPGTNEAIIISGTTSKSRYSNFKNIFEGIIQSLNF